MALSSREREELLMNAAASAIAAFQLAQIALWNQVQSGALPFSEVKQQLEQAIKANFQSEPIGSLVRQRVQGVLDMLERSERPQSH